MSTLVICLLGRPEIVRDGVVAAPPRGHKAWAVLAYVVLAERRVARARLAGLIFGEADDPLGALRWTLAQLRRALGVADSLRGDPLELGLPAGTAVDVRVGQLHAGRAAVDAGAVEPGVACLRQACAEARGVGDPALLARALAALGVALVHAVRGRDEEGAAVLHEALALAEATGDREVAGKVCRELGFVEVQAGRGVSAGRWLLRAGRLADDENERAAVLGVRGMALSDRAHYEAAITLLRESVATARRCGDIRQAAWSLAILGRALLLRGQLPDAVEVLDDSLALVQGEGWVAFQPFPEALRAEVALRQDDRDHAAALLDHAFALGCRLGDPCWEAMAARARGLVHEAAGERASALECLRDAAVQRSVRCGWPIPTSGSMPTAWRRSLPSQ